MRAKAAARARSRLWEAGAVRLVSLLDALGGSAVALWVTQLGDEVVG
ncbi:hypothetical protein NR798_46030 [Archangium gephyra]